MRVQGVGPAVTVQVRVLLHLQGHDLLLLSVSQVIGGVPLGAAAPVDIVPPFVLLVVEGGKSKNVEEEEGSSDGDGDRQLGGVVSLVRRVWLVLSVLGLSGEGRWVWTLGDQDLGLWSAVWSFWWRNLDTTRRLSCTWF